MGLEKITNKLKSFAGGQANNDETTYRKKLKEKNERLRRLRGRLEQVEQENARLREKLAEPGRERQLPRFFDTDRPVFFVVGQGKSGTTWLRNVLNAHPEILCRGEGRFFERDFVRVVPPEDLEKGWLKSVQHTSLRGAIHNSELLKSWIERSVWTDDGRADEHLDNISRLAVNYFLTRSLSASGKKIVGDKTTFSSGEIVGEIHDVYPEARVLHVIRDGRDGAVSMIHHMWNYSKDEGAFYDLEPEDLERKEAYRKDPSSALVRGLFTRKRLTSIARSWATQVSRVVEDGPRLLGENYAEVRYEDLLQRPEAEMKRILDFLGAEADEETVRGCLDQSSFEKLSEGRGRGEEQSSSFYRKGIAGDWKNVFTEEDRRIFKEVAGGLLVRLGYEEDEEW